jgi:PTH1 family peptidyl-tRNA hydrolase
LSIGDFLVIHDDVSLPLGRLRFQKGGGAGGQHGIESIIECMGGDNNFDRLKFGVGPDPGGDKRADYVLSNIPSQDLSIFETMLEKAIKGIDCWLKDGIEKTCNAFNGNL